MPIKARNRLLLTLFTALFLAVASTHASDVHSPLQLRDHAHLRRIIRKRAPAPQESSLIDLINAGAAPEPPNKSVEGSSSDKPASSSSISSSGSSTATGSQSSTSSVPTSSGSSTESSSSSTAPASAETPPDTTIPTRTMLVTTQTQFVDDSSQPTNKPPAIQGNAAKNASTGLTIVIVVAASIGAIAILWTIFRKWKLGSSAKFDKRLDPGWQPGRRLSMDAGIIPPNRRNSGHSVASGSHHGHGSGRGSDHGHSSLGPLPDHDFTASGPGPAPVGGYADLARGNGPQQMREHRQRGNDLNLGGYDTGVPLHHQAGYGNKAAHRFN